MRYSPISELFNSFFNKKITQEEIAPALHENKIVATTFRLPADIKNYYEKMAASSRVTLQSAVLQVLGGVMEQHINNQATLHARSLADRFYNIFAMHDIALHNIPRFLKEFNVTGEDIRDDIKIVDIISDKLIRFLEKQFNLNRLWIERGVGKSHMSFHCYKTLESWLALMKQREKPITLKLFFDEHILSDTAAPERYVKGVLIIEEELNEVKYKKVYSLESLDWDYKKTLKHVYGLIEGMNITGNYPMRAIEKYAGNHSETYEDKNFTINVLNNFKNSQTSFRSRNFSQVDEKIANIKKEEIELYRMYGEDSADDFHSVERDIERLRNNDLNFTPNFIRE